MTTVAFVSVLAANADATYRAIAGYLTRHAGVDVAFLDAAPWQERERMLEGGQAQLGAICGAQYVRMAGALAAPVQLLAAPVMQAARYRDQPIYFSDLVVRAGTGVRTFGDLRGQAWAYNEPNSYSGYQIVCAQLAALGEGGDYFGRIVAAGSHQAALRLVIAGAADVAAIDSTVLERELQLHPELAPHFRIIDSLGPSPIPPLVVAHDLPPATTRALRETLLHMHQNDEGRTILHAGLLARFTAVQDSTYDAIRAQLDRASSVTLADYSHL